MIRTSLIASSLLLVSACATTEDASVVDATDEVAEVSLEDTLVGSWNFDQTEVAFMEESDEFVTVPTTAYPDAWTEVHYIDGSASFFVKFAGTLTLHADGTLDSWVDAAVDEDGDGVREMDQGAVDERGTGTWWVEDGKLVLEHSDFYVSSFVELLSDDEIYMTWDRDDPEFLSDSCVLSINASRID